MKPSQRERPPQYGTLLGGVNGCGKFQGRADEGAFKLDGARARGSIPANAACKAIFESGWCAVSCGKSAFDHEMLGFEPMSSRHPKNIACASKLQRRFFERYAAFRREAF